MKTAIFSIIAALALTVAAVPTPDSDVTLV
jgi:hypothetical protein